MLLMGLRFVWLLILIVSECLGLLTSKRTFVRIHGGSYGRIGNCPRHPTPTSTISSPFSLGKPGDYFCLGVTAATTIDFQSDDKQFGRGDMHLSAVLEEGDSVVYQTGTWFVDGVQVGDGTPTSYEYARIDSVQVVWTHNCEHGVIRGFPLSLEFDDSNQQVFVPRPQHDEEDTVIEFGPEQLVARIPVEWNGNVGTLLQQIDDSLWDS